jgi:hypothetical protein
MINSVPGLGHGKKWVATDFLVKVITFASP